MRDFKNVDKVICVDIFIDASKKLILNKIYTVKDFEIVKVGYYNIELYEEPNWAYNIARFKLLSEYRKQKLKEICSTKEIK